MVLVVPNRIATVHPCPNGIQLDLLPRRVPSISTALSPPDPRVKAVVIEDRDREGGCGERGVGRRKGRRGDLRGRKE
jgi:hypothetical protein